MRKIIVVLGLCCGLALPQRALAERAPWHHGDAGRRRLRHLAAVAVGGLLYGASEAVFKGDLVASRCRWCDPPSFDTSLRDALGWAHPSRADTASNLTGYLAAPLFGVGLTALLAASATPGDESRVGRVIDDTLPIFESVVYSQLVVQAFKFSVGRQRPRVHFAEVPTSPGDDDNVSFFSGHTTLGFAIATSAGMVAHRRGYAAEPVIWSVGLSLAAITGYLRIAADEHYATDVGVGALFGAGMGYLIPRLLYDSSHSRRISLIPSRHGVMVVGRL